MVTLGNMENLHRSLKENSICAGVFLPPLMREVISSSKPQPNKSHIMTRKKSTFTGYLFPRALIQEDITKVFACMVFQQSHDYGREPVKITRLRNKNDYQNRFA